MSLGGVLNYEMAQQCAQSSHSELIDIFVIDPSSLDSMSKASPIKMETLNPTGR